MNRKRHKAPDLAALKNALGYNTETGIFTWKQGHCKGKVAGTRHYNGYIAIWWRRIYYQAHVLAWYYCHGEWPPNDLDVDHIDRIRNNNAINNLRLSTRVETSRNRTKWKNKKDGLPLGVHPVASRTYKGKTYTLRFPYQALIRIGGKSIRLGTFETIKEAEDAYISASKAAFGKFSPYK